MALFRGSSYHTIDDKGRIVIPSRFRDPVRANGADGLIVSRLDQCLVAYRLEEWLAIENKIQQLVEKSEHLRRFRRIFIGSASECACDKQDRILIPPLLRQYAGLNKDIVLVGVIDHFEIWSRERFENEEAAMLEDMQLPEAKAVVAKLGI